MFASERFKLGIVLKFRPILSPSSFTGNNRELSTNNAKREASRRPSKKVKGDVLLPFLSLVGDSRYLASEPLALTQLLQMTSLVT